MKPPISAAARRLCVRVVFIGVSSVPSLHPHAGKPVPDPSREIRCLVRRLGPLVHPRAAAELLEGERRVEPPELPALMDSRDHSSTTGIVAARS